MKAKLLRDCKPFGRTGEIAEVSPDHFEWLESLGYAVPVTEARERVEIPEAPETIKAPAKAAAKKKSSAKTK